MTSKETTPAQASTLGKKRNKKANNSKEMREGRKSARSNGKEKRKKKEKKILDNDMDELPESVETRCVQRNKRLVN